MLGSLLGKKCRQCRTRPVIYIEGQGKMGDGAWIDVECPICKKSSSILHTCGSWKDDTDEHLYEAMFLKLDCSKAKHRLGWSPTWSVQEALARVVHWQQAWLSGNNMKDLSLNEIVDFTVDMSDD